MQWPRFLASFCDVACELARDGGRLAQSMRGQGSVQQKRNATPVTDADVAVDQCIQRGLRQAFPDHAILSEEDDDDAHRLTQDWVWIIDPIDGTRAFIEGGPEWAIQIALSYHGQLCLGVVYQPDTNHLWLGCPGWGVWCSQAGRWQAWVPPALESPTYLRSRSTRSPQSYAALDSYLPKWQVKNCSSVGIKVIMMLQHGIPAYLHPCQINEWDYAAPVAVLVSAGGLATDWNGKALRFNQVHPQCSALVMTWSWPHHQLIHQLQPITPLLGR